jgi:hypothetical protein
MQLHMRQVTEAVDFSGSMGSIMRRAVVAVSELTLLLAARVQGVLAEVEVVVGKLLKVVFLLSQLLLQRLLELVAAVVVVVARSFHQALLVKKA